MSALGQKQTFISTLMNSAPCQRATYWAAGSGGPSCLLVCIDSGGGKRGFASPGGGAKLLYE